MTTLPALGQCRYLEVSLRYGPHIAIDVCKCERCLDPDRRRKREQSLMSEGYRQSPRGVWFRLKEDCNV